MFRAAVVVVAAIILFLSLDLIFPFKPNLDYSQIILAENGELLAAGLNRTDKRRFGVSLDETSPKLRKAILFKEDRYFYSHPGVNIISIGRAFWENITSGNRRLGASTITMQLARMLEPKARTYPNKAVEVFRALQLEKRYSKDEILEMYLNLIPFGGNIEGVGAASFFYFGVMPKNLSLAQSFALAVIPNDPNSRIIGRHNAGIEEIRNYWLDKALESGEFDSEEIAAARSEKLVGKRRPAPDLAPHLARRLFAEYPQTPVIRTFIDMNAQIETENSVVSYMKSLQSIGVENAAAIVVENSSGKVLVYVGSDDFFDEESSGQVDGIRAVRSPGSSLKPIAYALGFDLGLITPRTVVYDIPITDEYSPENFDGAYLGEMTVEEALIKSRNVPAVNLVKEIGLDKFLDKLAAADFETIVDKRKDLGLSTVLGGCGATLEELTRINSAFARGGSLPNLLYCELDRPGEKQIFSKEASFLVADILSKAPRPDILVGAESASEVPTIAWKTGTSYGRRDAWSVGFTPKYTVGVWAGNFSGKPNRNIAGLETATPLLFRIFRNLPDAASQKFSKPENLGIRPVDSETGLSPGKHTIDTIQDYFIPLVSSVEKSDLRREVYVSADETVSYCRDCLPFGGYKKKVYKIVPPELADFYRDNGIPYEAPPPHNPNCLKSSGGSAPVILSPKSDLEYFIQEGTDKKIAFVCAASTDATEIFWYVDDALYKRCLPSETVFFTPEKSGVFKISCSDDKGRNSDAKLKVKIY